ncbi:DUF4328 domain-containing protein [Sphingomonas sp. MMS12-HWE2-04]|uniref:DUF4328 domain-containing protein n=1 Tax=Sphingomonas sp. MMS12-HWE2-04 TaxID=3234199 RepID=UPI0038502F2E
MGVRDLRSLMRVVIVMVVLDALSTPAILVCAQLFPEHFTTTIAPDASALDGAAVLLKLATYIIFAIWIYRAGKNLLAAGFSDLSFTPGTRIGWFAVPIANLFKPYQGMRELWNASHGETDYSIGNNLLGAWWALWLINNFLAYFVGLAAGEDAGTGALWFQSAVDAASAVTAILVVRGITEAQTKLGTTELAEVFA